VVCRLFGGLQAVWWSAWLFGVLHGCLVVCMAVWGSAWLFGGLQAVWWSAGLFDVLQGCLVFCMAV